MRQWAKELKPFYVILPDLQYSKSMLHAILIKYSSLGVEHLAKLSGYLTEKQWYYLVNGSHISKSCGFIERLCDSMRMVYTFEFLSHLNADNTPEAKECFRKILLGEADKTLTNSLIRGFNTNGEQDEVWTKNFELYKLLENLVGHYTGERTRNFQLRNACTKDSLPFAMVSNCTQYGPLIIDLIFHTLQMQPRYRDLLEKGYFVYNISEEETPAMLSMMPLQRIPTDKQESLDISANQQNKR